jgi:hypothetical protein
VKKSLAYAITAVLLGTAIMILPFWASSNTPPDQFSFLSGSEDQSASLPQAALGGLANSLGFVGLMFAVSLILASGVYLFSKRRMPL